MSKTCPVPGMSELHERAIAEPLVGSAATVAGFTALWYALPDFCHRPAIRGLLKTGILAALMAYLVHLDDETAAAIGMPPVEEITNPLAELPAEWSETKKAAVATALVGATIVVTDLEERWLFQRAERKRIRGRRAAHTKQGLVLGALTFVGIIAIGKYYLAQKG